MGRGATDWKPDKQRVFMPAVVEYSDDRSKKPHVRFMVQSAAYLHIVSV